MTENEAIAKMKYRIKAVTNIAGKGVDGKAYEDMEMAIKALEEIQQYRVIGTVDECRDAMEKQKAEKPYFEPAKYADILRRYTCRRCGKFLGEYFIDSLVKSDCPKYCSNCGKRIDLT